MGEVILIIFMILPFILGYMLYKSSKQKKDLISKLEKYSGIIELDEYKLKLETDTKSLASEILSEKQVLDKLKEEVIVLDEKGMFQSFGIYEPIFDFDDSQDYKDKLSQIKDDQKEMIKEKQAATCSIEWTVDGSKTKGRVQTNNNIKLVLRAFNGECDAAIAKVKYNNIISIQTRIEKAFIAINKAVSSNHITIDDNYLELKIEELKITHELKEKQFEEKEEQRQIKEQMREEEKALKEIEKAKLKAEQEESKYQEALNKARLEVEQTTGAKHDKMIEQIQKLEAQLLEAQENKKRAMSRAQMTKSGHVYVISNIGSFGENIYKVGMTRRLEPLDRVKELGDASVPFLFDVHAMIYSDNAPKLESELHKIFKDKRVNMVNHRKEFFNVTLSEIKEVVDSHHGKIDFTLLAEAKEYRETLSIQKNIVLA